MNTNMNDIRELTMDETDSVSGGTVIMPVEFINAVMSVSGKVFGKGAVLEVLRKAADEKGKQKQ